MNSKLEGYPHVPRVPVYRSLFCMRVFTTSSGQVTIDEMHPAAAPETTLMIDLETHTKKGEDKKRQDKRRAGDKMGRKGEGVGASLTRVVWWRCSSQGQRHHGVGCEDPLFVKKEKEGKCGLGYWSIWRSGECCEGRGGDGEGRAGGVFRSLGGG